MKLRNPFSEETRLLYLYRYDCDICGGNHGLELHHITGRNSNSPLNASVVCRQCHEHLNHNQEEEKILFTVNLMNLFKSYYQITKDDMEFMLKHKHLTSNNPDLELWLK